MKNFFRILFSILAAICLLKGIQIIIDSLYNKYGKRYIQAQEIEY